MYDLDITIPVFQFPGLTAVLAIFLMMLLYWLVKFIASVVTGG